VSIGGLFTGQTVFVVGVEDDAETGGLRMYVGHRSNGIYAIVEDEDAKDELRRAWASLRHVIVGRPPANVLYAEAERP
jgi:hypothetical protein